MQTYSEYAPTPFDPKGLNLDDQQDWLVVPVGQNRDSEALAQSNFAAAVAMLEEVEPEDAEEPNYEVCSFGHWACGWIEIIIVRPGSKAQEVAEEIEKSLEDYPVLDEDDHSQREWEEWEESWNNWLCGEFRKSIIATFEWRDEDADDAEETFESHVDDLSNEILHEEYTHTYQADFYGRDDDYQSFSSWLNDRDFDVREWVEGLWALEQGITTGPQYQENQLELCL